MSLPWSTAVELATKLGGEGTQGLGMFEAVALQRHPDALAHMGETGRGIRASMAKSVAASVAGIVMAILGFLALIAPIIGLAAILGDPAGFHRMDASTSVPIAGVSFAVAAVALIVVAVRWWRGGRQRHPLLLIFGFGTMVCAAATWVVMENASSFDGFDDWAAWRLPVAIAGVLGVAFGALVLAAGRPKAPPEPIDPAESRSLREAIDAIPDDERAAILRDRNAAIAMMVEKGRFAPEVGERAMRAELGTLHRIDAEMEGARR